MKWVLNDFTEVVYERIFLENKTLLCALSTNCPNHLFVSKLDYVSCNLLLDFVSKIENYFSIFLFCLNVVVFALLHTPVNIAVSSCEHCQLTSLPSHVSLQVYDTLHSTLVCSLISLFSV